MELELLKRNDRIKLLELQLSKQKERNVALETDLKQMKYNFEVYKQTTNDEHRKQISKLTSDKDEMSRIVSDLREDVALYKTKVPDILSRKYFNNEAYVTDELKKNKETVTQLNIELATLREDNENTMVKIGNLQKENEEIKQQAEAEVMKLQAEIRRLREEIVGYEEKIIAGITLEERLQETNDRCQKLEAEKQGYQNEKEAVLQRIRNLESESEEKGAELRSKEEEWEAQGKELLKYKSYAQRYMKKAEELEEHQSRSTPGSDSRSVIGTELKDAREELDVVQSELGEAKKKNATLEKKIKDQERECQDHLAKIAEKENEIELQKDDFIKRLERKEITIEKLKKDRTTLPEAQPDSDDQSSYLN
ncbi:restin homolog isoform X2 [Mya arenaria]|uniref:restin homolog isoform X2 n=1 Tax=Mya arenaria TaxID=6604 RepID=UPI0022E127D8|nr:restin homolog isoform X2 [Mya arenaria]